MYKRIFLFSVALLSVTLLAFLFVPFFSGFLIQQASVYFLNHRLTLNEYHFNPDRLYLDGRFDNGDTIVLSAKNLLASARTARLTLNANAELFSELAGAVLPNIPFDAVVSYDAGRATLHSTLLDGTLDAEMNFSDTAYTYAAERLRLEKYLKDQEMPIYASGTLSANGSGTASAPFNQNLKLISNDLKLLSPLLLSSGLGISAPLDTNLSAEISLNDLQNLKSTLTVNSSAFHFSLDAATFNIAGGGFTLPVFIENRTVESVPLSRLNVLALGRYGEETITGNLMAEADDYLLLLNNINFETDQTFLTSNYRFSTLTETPLKLNGKNTLFGALSLQDTDVNLTLRVHDFPTPLRASYRDNAVTLISNNIPVGVLLDILNRPASLRGDIDLNTTVELGSDLPRIRFASSIQNLMPEPSIARKLAMTDPARIDLNAFGDDGNYTVRIKLASSIARTEKSELQLDALRRSAVLDAVFRDIHLPGYDAETLDLRSRIDFNRSVLSDTLLATENETISVPELSYGEAIKGSFSYKIGRLDRWASGIDPSEHADGNGSVFSEGNTTGVILNTPHLGRINIEKRPEKLRFHADDVKLKPIFTLLGKPAPFEGSVSLSAVYDDRAFIASLHAARLQPLGDLNNTLRAFPLEGTLDLSRCGDRYFGRLDLSTDSDVVRLTSIELDTDTPNIKASWLVGIEDFNSSVIRAPKQLGKALTLTGSIDADPKRQQLQLNGKSIALSPEVHRLFDKNATMPLYTTIALNTVHMDNKIALSGSVATDPVSIEPLQAEYDLNRSRFDLNATLLTQLWLKDTKIGARGTVSPDGIVRKGMLRLDTQTHDLNVTNVYLNPGKKDYRADIALLLSPLTDEPGSRERPALLRGSVATKPAFSAQLYTESFEGNLSAVMNEDDLIVYAKKLPLHPVIAFFKKVPLLESGTLDASIILGSTALLDGNLSRLNGGVDLKLHNLYFDGIALDDYLSTLRNTQDFSLFQGSFSDLPIIRSVKNIPADLLKDKNLTTTVPQARIALSVHDGIATCEDCAAATLLNRVALAGDVNLSSQRFGRFYFALLNPEGCPYFMQRIKGPLASPEINLASSGIKVIGGAVVSLASNVTDAADWATGLINQVVTATGDVISYVPLAGKSADKALTTVSGSLHSATGTLSGCTPFYVGTVPHPKRR